MNINATILGQTIAFILFVMFCMKYVWPPLIATLEMRQKEVADSLASLARAKKDLAIAQAEAIHHLKQAKAEAKAIIDQANKRKVQMIDGAKVIAKAEAEMERNKILSQAQAKINTEYRRTREELRNQVSMLILAGVEKIIERSLDEATNRDIIDKVIAKL